MVATVSTSASISTRRTSFGVIEPRLTCSLRACATTEPPRGQCGPRQLTRALNGISFRAAPRSMWASRKTTGGYLLPRD
jgi:hypothetical protein